MRKNSLLLVILAFTLVFGMMVIGCGDDNDPNNDNGNDNGAGNKNNTNAGTVSLSLITKQQLSTFDSKYYYTIGIPLKISGGSWNSDPGITAKSWVNVTTAIDLTSWAFQADYSVVMPDILTIWYISPAQDTSITMPAGGITVSIDSEKLSEMKGYTNVTGTLTIGTSSASSSAWTN